MKPFIFPIEFHTCFSGGNSRQDFRRKEGGLNHDDLENLEVQDMAGCLEVTDKFQIMRKIMQKLLRFKKILFIQEKRLEQIWKNNLKE